MSVAHAPALEITGLSKHFGGARALRDVALTVRSGEVHGLLGQNGSGKSTLIKILAGFHAPDRGARLRVGGKLVQLPLAPGDFRRIGIAFVHQHLGLVPSMSVLENLLIGKHAGARNWFIDWPAELRRAHALMQRFGLAIDPAAQVEVLSSVERALFAIVRAFDQLESTPDLRTRLLVLDEPTPFLPAQDVSRLFSLVRAIVSEGACVIFVSHDIDEVMEITDRVTVLRDGAVVGCVATRDACKPDIIQMIVGRQVDLQTTRSSTRAAAGPGVSIQGLTGRSVEDFFLQAGPGEVVGLTGLLNSGYEEIVSLCYGASAARAGTLTLDGVSHDLRRLSPHAAIRAGIVLIPDDRLSAGIVADLSVTDNATLPVLGRFAGGRFIRRDALRRHAAAACDALDVRPRDPGATMANLSGGNQQKVVLAKWFQIEPRLVLLHEPTQGIDVGARERVFAEIGKVAASGATVLCASSDHEQLAAICDRVLVLSRGRVVAQLEGAQLSKSAIARSCYSP